MIIAITLITTAEIATPHMPLRPKPTKYCMISCPEAKPAPTMTPTKARATRRICPSMGEIILPITRRVIRDTHTQDPHGVDI